MKLQKLQITAKLPLASIMIEVISRLHLGDVTLGVVSVDVNFVHDLHQSFTEIDERLLIVLLDKMDMKVINYVQEV